MKCSPVSWLIVASSTLLAGCGFAPQLAHDAVGHEVALVAPCEANCERTGFLVVEWEVARSSRGIQSLPPDTERLDFILTGTALVTPYKGSVTRGELQAANEALRIERIPFGDITLRIVAVDAGGTPVGEGTAATRLEPGRDASLHVTLTMTPPTGILRIEVDS